MDRILQVKEKLPAPSDFGDSLASSSAYSYATQHGLRVVLPRANELLIDIDSSRQLEIFDRNYPRLIRYVGVIDRIEKASRSGEYGRRHITVVLERDVTPTERILLQAVLGSDLTREFLSYARILEGDPNPTLFLENGINQLAHTESKLLTDGGA